MKVLLVEPKRGREYHTTYPPLALLKLSTFHKKKGDSIKLVNGISNIEFKPDLIYITSLFTYAWKPVHEVIRYYAIKFRNAKVVVGGIYATLCSQHLYEEFGDRIEIHGGLFPKIDNLIPDYSLVPEWKTSIVFSSRGCPRNCPFCSVCILEPEFISKRSIKKFVYPGHEKIVFWDNNILATSHWNKIFKELHKLDMEVDFNQGLDARLLTDEVAFKLSKIRIKLVRLAYDSIGIKNQLFKAISHLKKTGIKGNKIIVYCLYNYKNDSPEIFLERIKNLMEWRVVAYPMRYEPLEPSKKNTYVSENWTLEKLEMLAKARRVLGFGGAFPAYVGLRKKILKANSFEDAFSLIPI